MAFDWLPNSAPHEDEDVNWVTKGWFDKIYRWLVGESYVEISQTAAVTLSDYLVYPIDATSGNLVITLPPAQDYDHKKYIVKKTDSSANTVTITAAGSDLIDGAATKVLTTRYESVEIISDGVSNWHLSIVTVGGNVTHKASIYTANDTFTWATGVEIAFITMTGAGGGGGRPANAGTSGGGGGGSGEIWYRYPFVRSGVATTAITIGAAGTGATATNTNGVTGGATSFGTLSAAGGIRGLAASTAGTGGGAQGGAASTEGADKIYNKGGSGGGLGGAPNNNGGVGAAFTEWASNAGGTKYSTTHGGGGGGASGFLGRGGVGGAAGATTASPGVAAAGTAYGAGGGGGGTDGDGSASGDGGNGAGGWMLVEWIE